MKNKHIHLQRRRILKFMLASGLLTQAPLALSQQHSKALTRKTIPSSGEKIPVIGLGTSRVFEVGTSSAARKGPAEVLKILADIPNSMMDTSPMYGSAETVVGDLSYQQKLRDQLFFATKVWTDGRETGAAQMERSAQLMNTEAIDLMQVHNLRDTEVHLATIREWQDDGRIRYNGLTHYTAGAHAALEAAMREHKPQFIQINYSLGEREAENGVLPLAEDLGIAVLINRPYQAGRLFRAVSGKDLPDFAREFANSWGQFFLKFIVSHPAVTSAIPATSKPHHMADNLGAGFGTMPDPGMRKRMADYFASL